MGDFTMPSLGADMDRGTLNEWLVAPGDHVRRGDIVAVIQTDKSDVEVEVFESGVIDELLVEPGTEVAVGTPLARISASDEPAGGTSHHPSPHPGSDATATAPSGPRATPPQATPARATAAPQPLRPPEPTAAATPLPTHASPAAAHASMVLSPVVRQLAATLHVDTRTLHGTGRGGRITRHDVEEAARAPQHQAVSPYARRLAADRGIAVTDLSGSGPNGAVVARDVPAAPTAPTAPATPTAPTTPVDRQQAMRSAIARLMVTSNREIPHYHVLADIDLDHTLRWLDDRNAGRPPRERVLPAALLIRATALALGKVPELNGWWRDDRFEPADHVDLAMAVSLRGGGLVTPTLAGVDALDLPETMHALRTLVERARRGRLRGADLSPATATITNLGERGADAVLGLINPPQVALVGFGAVVDQVRAVDGKAVVRRGLTATLSGDHRATDGHAGSRFLAALADALARPDHL